VQGHPSGFEWASYCVAGVLDVLRLCTAAFWDSIAFACFQSCHFLFRWLSKCFARVPIEFYWISLVLSRVARRTSMDLIRFCKGHPLGSRWISYPFAMVPLRISKDFLELCNGTPWALNRLPVVLQGHPSGYQSIFLGCARAHLGILMDLLLF
jgi:hypothetical protein